VTVIAPSGGTPSVLAAKSATTTIAIVFSTASDPVAAGYVASLSRPGGNLTGMTTLNVEVGPKRLELLHELVPTAGTIALLVNPTNPAAEIVLRDLQRPARIHGGNAVLQHGVGKIGDAVLDGVVEPLELGVRFGRTLAQFGDLRRSAPAINLKTAKALGLDVPATVLALADEVIE
jgi:hypothetical protein